MYLQHFGLREYPFSLTPDTSFYYNFVSHHEALNVLLVAIRNGEGFIKVTGEVGLGKTMLCRKMLKALGVEYVGAYIANPQLSGSALAATISAELGVNVPPRARADSALRYLNTRLSQLAAAGRHVVVVLDEAQAMPDETLEAVRLLTNLETEKTKLMQVVLFGQPELDMRLAQPHLRQLKQRITFSYKLHAMDRPAIGEYVRHRLTVAGHSGKDLFNGSCIEMIYRGSAGVPRLINVLCHKSLLAAYGPGRRSVSPQDVRLAIEDTEGAHKLAPRWLSWPFWRSEPSAIHLPASSEDET